VKHKSETNENDRANLRQVFCDLFSLCQKGYVIIIIPYYYYYYYYYYYCLLLLLLLLLLLFIIINVYYYSLRHIRSPKNAASCNTLIDCYNTLLEGLDEEFVEEFHIDKEKFLTDEEN
jgi:hypothetical protein